MTHWKNYYLAQTIPDALNAMAQSSGPVSLVAGGTDLLLDIQQGRHPAVHTLVDVTPIPELNTIEIRQDSLFIGAGLPLNRVLASAIVQEHAQALIEAAGLIGGPQVRNTATLGGNVGHALPAADGTIALLALGAQAEIADENGCRKVPLENLFAGPGVSTLLPGKELLSGFYLPLRTADGLPQASAFRRVMRPQGVAIAILNMGVWLSRDSERIGDIRIAIGPAGPTPRRLRSAEDVLRGKQPETQALQEGLSALLAETHYRTSRHRATAAYRQHLTKVLLEETLNAAWQRSF